MSASVSRSSSLSSYRTVSGQDEGLCIVLETPNGTQFFVSTIPDNEKDRCLELYRAMWETVLNTAEPARYDFSRNKLTVINGANTTTYILHNDIQAVREFNEYLESILPHILKKVFSPEKKEENPFNLYPNYKYTTGKKGAVSGGANVSLSQKDPRYPDFISIPPSLLPDPQKQSMILLHNAVISKVTTDNAADPTQLNEKLDTVNNIDFFAIGWAITHDIKLQKPDPANPQSMIDKTDEEMINEAVANCNNLKNYLMNQMKGSSDQEARNAISRYAIAVTGMTIGSPENRDVFEGFAKRYSELLDGKNSWKDPREEIYVRYARGFPVLALNAAANLLTTF